jgi:hypothetical protein
MTTTDLHIEWCHPDEPGAAVLFCSDTARPLTAVVADIREMLKARGVRVDFSERACPAGEMNRPGVVLLNGIPLEKVVPLREKKSPCAFCGVCDGSERDCATGERDRLYHDIPESVLRLAALRAAGLK